MSPLTDHPPGGLLRLALRLPVWLYRARLGWLLGERFLLLTHIGRRSGLPRHTVLEVVDHDPAHQTYIVASAWRERSDWFRNVSRDPRVQVQVGRRRFAAVAERLPPKEAEQALRRYARRNPRAFRALVQLLTGRQVETEAQACRDLAAQVPLVALRKVQ